jgi:hypothetical protein
VKVKLQLDTAGIEVPINDEGTTTPTDSNFGEEFKVSESVTSSASIIFCEGDAKAHRIARLNRVEFYGRVLPE